jgi:hypothetical protein
MSKDNELGLTSLEEVELGLRNIGGAEGVNRRHNSQIVREKFVNAFMSYNLLLNCNATT